MEFQHNLIIVHGIRTEETETWPDELKLYLQEDEWIKNNVNIIVYRYEYISLLETLSPFKRNKIQKGFREFLIKLSTDTNLPISIFAHSFGTNLTIRSMIEGPQHTKIDCAILMGCIVDHDFNFKQVDSLYNRIINCFSTRDSVVRFSPEPAFGKACTKGFLLGKKYVSGSKDHGVFNTDDLQTGHMDFVINKEKWFPFIKNMIKIELGAADVTIKSLSLFNRIKGWLNDKIKIIKRSIINK